MTSPDIRSPLASNGIGAKSSRRARLFPLLASWVVLLSVGQTSCSGAEPDGGPSGSGTGGASATGGLTGSGGETVTGGSGGVIDASSGGTASGGATTETGGAPGTGGIVEATGGADGTGGDVGTGGADGTGGDAGFQPCPETGACKILPLGDSITRGFPDQDSYRVHLFELAIADGHEVTFVGTRMGGPAEAAGLTFPRNHEGIDGETVAQIAGRIPSPALNDMPHIILVHAGTNDLTGNNANVSGDMASLLDELISDAPDALIVVARVIPIFYMLDGVNSYNDSVEALVEERALAGAHIIVVDQFEGFEQSHLGDQVHPNQAGYERMAEKWYESIESYLR